MLDKILVDLKNPDNWGNKDEPRDTQQIFKYEICVKSHCESPDFEVEGEIEANSEEDAIKELANKYDINEKDVHIESENEPDSDAEIARQTMESDRDDYNSGL